MRTRSFLQIGTIHCIGDSIGYFHRKCEACCLLEGTVMILLQLSGPDEVKRTLNSVTLNCIFLERMCKGELAHWLTASESLMDLDIQLPEGLVADKIGVPLVQAKKTSGDVCLLCSSTRSTEHKLQ
ncbi:hypothetical protein JOB18_002899 [Solea senegalensis]|uniref:Uncharacterized protein n=1 Tax=Solea senegalensis TaxID=28829 RepID=A0AAV6R834_SOLSE|nr:hypothetical protein JOB18_002899 [Solea senegalensis]